MSDPTLAYKLLGMQPWALTLPALEALVEIIRLQCAGGVPLPRAYHEEEDGAPAPAKGAQFPGGVGVISIRGTLKQHGGDSFFDFLFGGASADSISQQLRAFVADPNVKAIVLDIDSPGGSTYGMTELAGEIMAARGTKPIVALANSVAASGAYWLGAAADQLYVTPGGMVGSVGVYMLHMDLTGAAEQAGMKPTFISAGANKTRGNEFEPLSVEDVTHYQAIVDETYDAFVKDVARGRGVTPAAVRSGYGDGDMMTAAKAKKAGMVDGIMTLSEAIAKAQTIRSKAPKGLAAEAATDDEPQAGEEGSQRLRLLQWRAQQALAATAKTGGPVGY